MSTEAVIHKEDPGILKLTLILTAITTMAGVILGGVAYFTMPVAYENQIKAQQLARQQLLPAAASFTEIEGHDAWYVGIDSKGQPVGYIIKTAEKGYGGSITMLAGVDKSLKLIDYKVLSHNETPGLGELMKKEKFKKQFRGRDSGQMQLTKRGEEGKIQALTGATITSRAVMNALINGLKELKEVVGKTTQPKREQEH